MNILGIKNELEKNPENEQKIVHDLKALPVGVEDLAELLNLANDDYRRGEPWMSDATYDVLVKLLAKIDSDNEWLSEVEPEPEDAFSGEKVFHKNPMLSTDKAYTKKEMESFCDRVEKAAEENGMAACDVCYKVTAKLDGLAGFRKPVEGVEMATRGNGLQGVNISEAFSRLKVIGNDVEGPGEIVMPEEFFVSELKNKGFKSSRNFMVGFVGAETLKEHHRKVMEKEMGHFVPYPNLPAHLYQRKELLENIESISKAVRDEVPYETDGVVIEAIEPALKTAMGSTSHHHRWQIAFKTNGESVEATVNNVVWQTGRTGRVTPVIHVDPVELPGATVRKATAHTAKKIVKMGIGKGAIVRLLRAGDSVPKIVGVEHAVSGVMPDKCPCCGSKLEEDGEYLTCINPSCSAQAERRIMHFFNILGNADGFGPKSAETLVANGITSVIEVLKLRKEDFMAAGFGAGESSNFIREIRRCLSTPVEDWRFLAAFGVRHLGRGDSRKLLKAIGGMDGLDDLSVEGIMAVDGFGEKTAKSIYDELSLIGMEIDAVLGMGIPLISSKQDVEEGNDGTKKTLDGLSLVFTGTFSVGRSEMEDEARKAGAQVQSSVNGKTTALVAGDKTGATKTEKAKKLGVAVWNETEYRAHLNG